MRPPVLWNADSLERGRSVTPSASMARFLIRRARSSRSSCSSARRLVRAVADAAGARATSRAARSVCRAARRSRHTRARFDLDRSPVRAVGAVGCRAPCGSTSATRFSTTVRSAPLVVPRGRQHRGARRRRRWRRHARSAFRSASSPAAAARHGCRACVRGASLVFLSVPPLLTSLVLVFIAARTRMAAAGRHVVGRALVDAVVVGVARSTSRWHLPLPALALALPIAATFERLQSQAMTEARAPAVRCSPRSRAASPQRDSSGATPGRCRCGRSAASTAWRSARCSPARSSSSSSPPGRASAG